MPDSYDRKGALARLRSGNVVVIHAERLGGNGMARADVIIAKVASTREEAKPHRVDRHNGAFRCSCGLTSCVHIAAVSLVTGYDPAGAA